MEPTANKVRYKLLLAKAQVTKIKHGELGCRFSVALPNGITIEADLSFVPDVRVGDVLSVYTELYAHANPGPSSIQ